MPEECTLVELPKLEFFREGDYGARGNYSASDLRAIASEYSEETHHAPITIDHIKTGPAYGWINGIEFREGAEFSDGKSRLFTSSSEATPEFEECLRLKQFPKRSAEFYRPGQLTDKWYLKRVTFLGAKIPDLKGMADPAFSEGESATVEFEDTAESPEFSVPEPQVPEGASFGIIKHQTNSDTVLEHYHRVYLDEDGNGYSGPGLQWRGDEMRESDSHQHIITDKLLIEAPTGMGASHTHQLFSEFSEEDPPVKDPKTTTTDPKTPNVNPEADPSFVEPNKADIKDSPEFAELQERVTRQDTELSAMREKTAMAEFSEKCARLGLTPASKAKAETFAKALYCQGETATVEFAEGKPTSLIDGLHDFIGSIEFAEGLDKAKAPSARILESQNKPDMSDPQKAASALAKRAREIQAEKKVSFAEAGELAAVEFSEAG